MNARKIFDAIRSEDYGAARNAIQEAIRDKIEFRKEMRQIEEAHKLNESPHYEETPGATVGDRYDHPSTDKFQNLAAIVARKAQEQGVENVEDEKFMDILNGEIEEVTGSDDAKSRQEIANAVVATVREYDLLPGTQYQKQGTKGAETPSRVHSSADYYKESMQLKESAWDAIKKLVKGSKTTLKKGALEEVIQMANLRNYTPKINRGAAAGLDMIDLHGDHGYHVVAVGPVRTKNTGEFENWGVIVVDSPRTLKAKVVYETNGHSIRHAVEALEWADRNL